MRRARPPRARLGVFARRMAWRVQARPRAAWRARVAASASAGAVTCESAVTLDAFISRKTWNGPPTLFFIMIPLKNPGSPNSVRGLAIVTSATGLFPSIYLHSAQVAELG